MKKRWPEEEGLVGSGRTGRMRKRRQDEEESGGGGGVASQPRPPETFIIFDLRRQRVN